MSLTEEQLRTSLAERANNAEIQFDLDRVKADAAFPETTSSNEAGPTTDRPRAGFWAAAAAVFLVAGGFVIWSSTRSEENSIDVAGNEACGVNADTFCADQLVGPCGYWADGRSTICLSRPGNAQVDVIDTGVVVSWLSIDPQLRYVLATNGDASWLVSPSGEITEFHQGDGAWAEWFGSEGLIALRYNNAIDVVDVERELIETIWLPEISNSAPFTAPVVSPDGRLVAMRSGDPFASAAMVWVYDRSESAWQSFQLDSSGIAFEDGLAWNDDGSQLYVVGEDPQVVEGGVVYSLDISSGQFTELTKLDGALVQVVPSPDGQFVAVREAADFDTTSITVHVFDADSWDSPRGRVELDGSLSVGSGLSWSYDSTSLVHSLPATLIAVDESGGLGEPQLIPSESRQHLSFASSR